MPDGQAETITPKQAAKMLGVSPGAVVGYANRGLLRTYRTLGGHRRFLRSEVEAIAAEQAAQVAAS